MTNYHTGHDAEQVAAQYVADRGYIITATNWKTRNCEVDIIATKSKIVYFIEVKFRKNSGQGSGLDYITPKKMSQMQFAAQIWVSQHNFSGDYRLAAIEVSGDPMYVTAFLPDLSV